MAILLRNSLTSLSLAFFYLKCHENLMKYRALYEKVCHEVKSYQKILSDTMLRRMSNGACPQATEDNFGQGPRCWAVLV